MTAWLLLIILCVVSFLASAVLFALQTRIRAFRIEQLEREMAARWERLDQAGKVEALRRMCGVKLMPVRPVWMLDGIFRQLLGRAWDRLVRKQDDHDFRWLDDGLRAAGV